MPRLNLTNIKSSEFDGDYIHTSELKDCFYRLTWTIKNYNEVGRRAKFLYSSKFPPGDHQLQWYLEVYPKPIEMESLDVIKIVLHKTLPISVYVQYSLAMKSSQSSETEVLTWEDFTDILSMNGCITRSAGVRLLAETINWDKESFDNLIIICAIRTFWTAGNIQTENAILDCKNPYFIGEISMLHEDKSFSDVTFFVQGKKFKAHKNILSVRSSVFGAMFRNKMSEKVTGQVEIEDVEPEIFEKMLKFIYSDQVDDLDEYASKLLIVAEKYDLQKLKAMCSVSLGGNLSIENILERTALAHLYSIPELKEKTLRFFESYFGLTRNVEDLERMVRNFMLK